VEEAYAIPNVCFTFMIHQKAKKSCFGAVGRGIIKNHYIAARFPRRSFISAVQQSRTISFLLWPPFVNVSNLMNPYITSKPKHSTQWTRGDCCCCSLHMAMAMAIE